MRQPTRTSLWLAFVLIGLFGVVHGATTIFRLFDAERERLAALERGRPPVVMLDNFSRTYDVHPANEVYIRGWINPKYSVRLLTLNQFGPTDARQMLVMFGHLDTSTDTVAKAAIVADTRYLDALERQMGRVTNMRLGPELLVAVNGRTIEEFGARFIADDNLARAGLTKSEDFVYIEPWSRSREADLSTPLPDRAYVVPLGIAGSGVLSILIGWALFRRNAKIYAALEPEARAEVRAKLRSGTLVFALKAVLWGIFLALLSSPARHVLADWSNLRDLAN